MQTNSAPVLRCHLHNNSEMKSILLRDGMRIAYQEWGATNPASKAKRILALHGWLDNSNSFKVLGPQLASIGYHMVAVDHLGHGKSTHINPDATYSSTPAGVAIVNEIVESLGWESSNILGHSMGAGISLMFAGTFPEKVNKLVLIEGLGPVTAEPEATPKNLRKSIEHEKKYQIKVAQTVGGAKNVPKIYPSFNDAVAARVKSVSTYPGEQSLSVEAARLLVARGTYRVDGVTGAALPQQNGEVEGDERDCVEGDGAVRFRHDPRLVLSSRIYLTNEQVLAIVDDVTARTLFISAEKGWPLDDHTGAYEKRISSLSKKGLLTHKHLAGSHHLHLDPETEPSVTHEVKAFLEHVHPHLGGKIEF